MADVERARHRGRRGVDGEHLVTGGRAVERVDAVGLPPGRPGRLEALEAGLVGDAPTRCRRGRLGPFVCSGMIGLPYPACSSSTTPPPAEVAPLRLREPGKVSLYVCGPTVDGVPHLGHGRFSLVFDVLRRYLLFSGLDVTYVSNITDIEDKIIDRAAAEGVPIAEFTAANEALWWEIDGRPRRAPPRRDAPRHRLRRPDDRPHRRPGGPGRGLRDGDRRLPVGARRPRLRAAGPPAPRLAAGRRPDRGRRGEAVAPRLRAVEEGQAGRAELGRPVGCRPARVAHRVRGDVPRPPGRGVRAARRRPGPDVPPPRERAGPGRGRRQGVRPPLDAQRLGDRRRREDVQVARQLHLPVRPPGPQRRPRLPAAGAPLPLPLARSRSPRTPSPRPRPAWPAWTSWPGASRSPTRWPTGPPVRAGRRPPGDVDADAGGRVRGRMDDDLDTPGRWPPSSTWPAGPTPRPTPATTTVAARAARTAALLAARPRPPAAVAAPEPRWTTRRPPVWSRQRDEARAARDWARADALRAELEAAGWLVEDSAAGTRIRRR